MENKMPKRLNETAKKMAKVGRPVYKPFRRPSLKEYTLIKYEGKRVISREKYLLMNPKSFLQMRISSGSLKSRRVKK